MRHTKLILVEGIPGCGKSTLAHALARQLAAQGHAVRWWYEEEIGHPVYLFRDHEGLVRVVDDLAAGDYRRVIADALAQWRVFAARMAAADEIVILDGTLFGYLTWSLFPYLVPEEEIRDYIAAVAAILADLDPRLIYLRQEDIDTAWRWLAERRGESWLQGAIERNTRWPYGAQHGLAGFAGLVDFWQAFQDLADVAFAHLPFATLRLSAAIADRAAYLPASLEFLDLYLLPEPNVTTDQLGPHVGRYVVHDDDKARLSVVLQGDGLHIDDLPQFWPQNRLLPLPGGDFAVEAFPHTIRFAPNGSLTISGPPLLSGPIPVVWQKQETDASRRSTCRERC